MAGCRGTIAALEKCFDETLSRGRARFTIESKMDVRAELQDLGFERAGAITPCEGGRSCKAVMDRQFTGFVVYAHVVGDQIKKFGVTKVPLRSRVSMKKSRRLPSKTSELATAYFRPDGPGVWEIRGAGAMYGPFNSMNVKLRAILDALKGDGIDVAWTSSGSPGNADEYRLSADFDDGGLAVRTGNYWGSPRGGFITGVTALRRLIRLLNLRASPRTARAWGLVQATDRTKRSSKPLRRTARQSRCTAGSRRDLVLDVDQPKRIALLVQEVLGRRLAKEEQDAAKVSVERKPPEARGSTPSGAAARTRGKPGKK